MITGIDMFKAPAGNWVVIVDTPQRPWAWYDYDYLPEDREQRLTDLIDRCMVRS